jgi:hypothetical protein
MGGSTTDLRMYRRISEAMIRRFSNHIEQTPSSENLPAHIQKLEEELTLTVMKDSKVGENLR